VRRVFWLAVGLGAGVTAAVMTSRWMRRQADRMAPANVGRELQNGLRDLGQLIRESIAEGRQAMHEKEAEIRSAIE
jgi:hypothetical protein